VTKIWNLWRKQRKEVINESFWLECLCLFWGQKSPRVTSRQRLGQSAKRTLGQDCRTDTSEGMQQWLRTRSGAFCKPWCWNTVFVACRRHYSLSLFTSQSKVEKSKKSCLSVFLSLKIVSGRAFPSVLPRCLKTILLSQKWDHLPGMQYANTHTEQRSCLYCIFSQIWVLGDSSTKLAHHFAESQRLHTPTKPKKLI